MADKWTDERDRDWRDRDWQRAERYGRGRDRDQQRRSEGRSFDPRHDDYSFADLGYGDADTPDRDEPARSDYAARRSGRDRDEVFGERQTGDDYSGGARGYERDYQGPTYGSRGQRYASPYYGRQESSGEYGRDQRRGERQAYGGRGYGGPAGAYGDYGRERRRADVDESGRYEAPHDYGFEPPEYGSVPMTYDSPLWQGPASAEQARWNDRREHHTPNVREGRGEGGRTWWDRAKTSVAAMFGDEEAERRHQWDRQMHGEHRGRGPKGYTRSDERISDDVHQRLTDDPWVDASDVEVRVAAGEVTLSGTVSDRDEKRRAEQCIEDVSGVQHVQNNLRLRYGGRSGETPLSSSDAGSISAGSATSGDLNLGEGRTAGAPTAIPGAETSKTNKN